jgi:hypothetical protein
MRELDIERRRVALRIQQDSLASTGKGWIGRNGRSDKTFDRQRAGSQPLGRSPSP